MSLEAEALANLQDRYRGLVRPFLEKTVPPERVREFDGDLRRVKEAHAELGGRLVACFLGSSGVGKSTLINALVAGHEHLVPSGGVGPLTAQALTIRFAEQAGFNATYHAAKTINQLIFALRQAFRSRIDATQAEVNDRAPADEAELGAEEIEEIQDAISAGDGDAECRADKYVRQARLMITGRQDSNPDLTYLLSGLTAAIERGPFSGSTFEPSDAERIERLRSVLGRSGKTATVGAVQRLGGPGFRGSLEEHATGFLAPVIRTLEVQWNSPLLADGVELVDLPGLGIEGDVYREVTRTWITEKAKAVILVVDHRGLTEANAQLLRTSGFLNRLLHSAYDASADPVSLIVAVVKIDDIADSRRVTDKSKSKREHFADIRKESVQLVQNQIRTQLEKAWSLVGDAPSEAKQQVIDNLVAGLKVYPLSAIQYRRSIAGDDDDPPFIRESGESGVPEMISGLSALARAGRELRERRFREARDLFISRVISALRFVRSQWEEESRASEEAERLRQDLQVFLGPLREEFRNRQGAFREFLKEGLPQRIERLVVEARVSSARTIRAYLRKLSDAHWKTLQAAVRRGGTYHGAKHIELPRDFALTFEEPIAEVWGEAVLKEIRRRTTEFADDCVALVDRVAAWAREQGARVRPGLVEVQRDAIRDDAKKLKTVGRDVVNGLREEVKNRLIQAVEPPIRRRCVKFVKDDLDVGPGVRNRILMLFDELAEEAIEAAVPPAKKVLLESYRQVEQEIREVFFAQHQDPLEAASEAIAASHESRRRRSDAQKRRTILAQADAALEGFPGSVPTEEPLAATGA